MPDRTPKQRGRDTKGAPRRRPAPPRVRSRAAPSLGSEVQSDIILETSPLGIVMVDAAGRIVRVNDRLEQMFGYSRGELAGLALDALLPERLRAVHARHRDNYFDDPHVRPMGL